LCDRSAIDGVELYYRPQLPIAAEAKRLVKGFHTAVSPSWLALWDAAALWHMLVRQCGGAAEATEYLGAPTRDALKSSILKQLELACRLEAEYAVFHACCALPEEMLAGRYAVTNEKVLQLSAELINDLCNAGRFEGAVLIENHWWPGLRLTEAGRVSALMSALRCADKGVLLDTGHLMQCGGAMRTENEAVDYMVDALEALGPSGAAIRGIHLHKSLPGERGGLAAAQALHRFRTADSSSEKARIVKQYVHSQDRHEPFESCRVREVVEFVGPEWLVHEFVPASYANLEDKLARQIAALRNT